jgi:hypothetical protein
MKFLVKLLIAFLFIGIAGLFVLKTPDGKPVISMKAITYKAKSFAQDSDLYNNKVTETEVYRWKDGQGKWQYSNVEPNNNQAKKVEQQVNIIPSKPKKITVPESNKSTISEKKTTPLSGLSPTTISPDKISRLIDEAKNVQQLMDKRLPEIESQLKK